MVVENDLFVTMNKTIKLWLLLFTFKKSTKECIKIHKPHFGKILKRGKPNYCYKGINLPAQEVV